MRETLGQANFDASEGSKFYSEHHRSLTPSKRKTKLESLLSLNGTLKKKKAVSQSMLLCRVGDADSERAILTKNPYKPQFPPSKGSSNGATASLKGYFLKSTTGYNSNSQVEDSVLTYPPRGQNLMNGHGHSTSMDLYSPNSNNLLYKRPCYIKKRTPGLGATLFCANSTSQSGLTKVPLKNSPQGDLVLEKETCGYTEGSVLNFTATTKRNTAYDFAYKIKKPLNPFFAENYMQDKFYYNLYACLVATRIKRNPIAAKISVSSALEVNVKSAEFKNFMSKIEIFVEKHLSCGEGCPHLYKFYESVGLISQGNKKKSQDCLRKIGWGSTLVSITPEIKMVGTYSEFYGKSVGDVDTVGEV